MARIGTVCGHSIRTKDHGFVGSDGRRIYDTRKCLDIAEGRKPEKFERDER